MQQVFISEDGKHFDTQEACEKHEHMAKYADVFKRWAYTKFFKEDMAPKGVHIMAARAANILIAWEQDREKVQSGEMQLKELPAKEYKKKDKSPELTAVA